MHHKIKTHKVMNNEDFLQRLLVLAEKQQGNVENLQNNVELLQGHITSLNEHICKLEEFIAAQQRTIDTLSAMAQPIYNISGGTNNVGNGRQIQVNTNTCGNISTDASDNKTVTGTNE